MTSRTALLVHLHNSDGVIARAWVKPTHLIHVRKGIRLKASVQLDGLSNRVLPSQAVVLANVTTQMVSSRSISWRSGCARTRFDPSIQILHPRVHEETMTRRRERCRLEIWLIVCAFREEGFARCSASWTCPLLFCNKCEIWGHCHSCSSACSQGKCHVTGPNS